jgi:hypothetical protein
VGPRPGSSFLSGKGQAAAILDALRKDGRIALCIHFEFGKATLLQDAQPVIDEIAKILQADCGERNGGRPGEEPACRAGEAMIKHVVLGALLFGAAVSAGLADDGLPALNDEACRQLAAALERWLPARDAATAAGLQDLARDQARVEAIEREIADIAAGRKDALAALKARSKRVAVPPAASYVPRCSAMFTAHTAAPTAIFTFGKAFRPRGPNVDLHTDPLDVDATSLAEWERISNAAIAFYEQKGFVRIEKDMTSLVWMKPRAEPRDVTVIICAIWNCGTTAFDDLLRACGDLPKGPALLLEPRQEGEKPAMAAPAAGAGGALSERMAELLSAAHQARQDLRAPEELRALEEAARTVPDESVRVFARTRGRNAEVYARHAARLDPLIERAIGQ